jgi:pimeloyl-ACP methyl ester carboxylesterase
MGGILAMMNAFRLPGAVKGLVLLDPPVPSVSRWARDPRLTAKLAFLRMPGVAALVARQVAGMTPEQLVARQLARATAHPGRIPVEAVDATVEETRATRGADPVVARHGRPARQSRGRACAGREPPEWGFRAREEVGHLPHLEDPAWTVQSIEEWLDHQVKSP